MADPRTPDAGDRAWDELVVIGRLVRPRGLVGELIAEVMSDRPDRFTDLRRAYVPGPGGTSRLVRISSTWPHKGRMVVKLEGVDSIDEAEAYRGVELRIGEEELAPLPEGSYYHHQLRGLNVEDASGAPLGRVEEVLDAGAAPVLVIRGASGETLLPLVDSFVERVELDAGRLVVRVPESVTC
jgi:16S rRNA processing protein RimM